MANVEANSPTLPIHTDAPIDKPDDGIALCLSGGGYRAMLFHVGALWRLNDAGYLPKLARVSSVSGGSITAGVLGLAWRKLDFDQSGVARSFEAEVVAPIMRMAGRTIDVPAVLRGLFGPGSISDQIVHLYRKYLFGSSKLSDLPTDSEGPRFVINATNMQSGVLWRFSRPYAADYRVGQILNPEFEVAVAVAASSAFPPFLSPTILNIPESAYSDLPGANLHRPPFTTTVHLTDGGVYDNLGLETAWKRYSTILVSDGGGTMKEEGTPHRFWPLHLLRVITLTDSQVRARRKIQVMTSYQSAPGEPGHRDGAYWSSWTDISEYGLTDTLDCPASKTIKLANLPTRLARMDEVTRKRLINWGFAVCDAAIRSYYDKTLAAPKDFPHHDAGVG